MSTAAREEAERRAYETWPNPPEMVDTPVLGRLIEKRAAFTVGFEAGWEARDAQVAELLPTLAKALGYRMSWIHDSGHIPKFGNDWRACQHHRCEETRDLMARALSDPGEEGSE